MRKLFTVFTAALAILCLWHAAMGSFMLLGISTRPAAFMGYLAGILAVFHILLGCRYWLRTLKHAQCFWYGYANRLFWLRVKSIFVCKIPLGIQNTMLPPYFAAG